MNTNDLIGSIGMALVAVVFLIWGITLPKFHFTLVPIWVQMIAPVLGFTAFTVLSVKFYQRSKT